ncbi:Os01g0637232 [Oryza sativa Japonica Group]|uniref:Os01g0637232 protein n=1 Tax=Oryza sativa subsp. japonica TaxID=39947 RepID=A0A0N7KDD9_ORYSJ|nr:Os01g0637232 [Oryza sativa Japonica Group]
MGQGRARVGRQRRSSERCWRRGGPVYAHGGGDQQDGRRELVARRVKALFQGWQRGCEWRRGVGRCRCRLCSGGVAVKHGSKAACGHFVDRLPGVGKKRKGRRM